ncbi:MAG: TonB-dependent receptor, partial [Acidobacteria bacterium]|nr:TonB-dependent receptor [Acidobacteriota bacterium]
AYGYSAEFGRSTGGIMNAVTKSGTNDWHGSAFFFNRHKNMSRKDALNRKALDSQNQFGGSLGGPLRRDKTFLFGAAEAQKISNPRNVIFRLLDTSSSFSGPTAFNTPAYNFYRGLQTGFKTTNDAWTVLGRWDEQWSSKHRTGVRYHYSTNTGKNAAASGGNLNPETSEALGNSGTEGDNQHSISGQWTGIFSPRVVNEFRAQYSLERRPRLANALQTGISNSIGVMGTRSFLPTTEKDYRIQISNGLSWNIATHSIKFGGDYNHTFADQFFKFNQYGIFGMTVPSACQNLTATSPGSAAWLLNVLSPGQDPAFPNGNACVDAQHRFEYSGTSTSRYDINIGNGLASMAMDTLSFFVQDSWRITPRLTLNYGFRWEGYWNPSPEVTNTVLYNIVKSTPFPLLSGNTTDPAVIPDNLKQPMPRIGLAWDPWGNGKTVFRANAGIYYAQTPLLLFAGPINNFRTPAGDLTVRLPFAFSGVCPALPPGSPAIGTFQSATNWCQTLYGQFLLANGAAGPALDLDALALGSLPTLTLTQLTNIGTALGLTVDPNRGAAPITWSSNYESPRSWQWNIAWEQEIARGLSIGADYAYINTVHLQRNRDFNLPTPVVCTGVGTPVAACTAADLAKRPCFAVSAGLSPCGSSTLTQLRPTVVANPTSALNSVQLRESTSHAFYRSLTMRATFRRPKYQVQAFYTLSKNLSDDDNERDAGGQSAVNSYNLRDEYGLSRLDAKHLFVLNSVVQFPWDFQVSGLAKLRSGRPLDPVTGSDSNGDTISNDRPFLSPGVPFARNSFRDRPFYNVDMRVSKRIKMPKEGVFFNITVDFFNLFDIDNVAFGSFLKRYGVGVNSAGALVAPNSTFMQLYSPSSCLTATNPKGNKGCYDTSNIPGLPFQMQ